MVIVHGISARDWPQFKRLMQDYARYGLGPRRKRPRREKRRPRNLVGMLLEPIAGGGSGLVRRLIAEKTTVVQIIELVGVTTADAQNEIMFRLRYGGELTEDEATELSGDNVPGETQTDSETGAESVIPRLITPEISINATGAEVRAALETLTVFEAGDLQVTPREIVWNTLREDGEITDSNQRRKWYVRFTPQFVARNGAPQRLDAIRNGDTDRIVLIEDEEGNTLPFFVGCTIIDDAEREALFGASILAKIVDGQHYYPNPDAPPERVNLLLSLPVGVRLQPGAHVIAMPVPGLGNCIVATDCVDAHGIEYADPFGGVTYG